MRTVTTTNPLHAPKTAVQTLYTEQDALALIRTKRDAGKSLRAIASEYGSPVNHADIERILQGRFPHSVEKRKALGLPPVCISCGQRVKPARHVPEWVKQAAQGLKDLEIKAGQADSMRTYSRQGRRVI